MIKTGGMSYPSWNLEKSKNPRFLPSVLKQQHPCGVVTVFWDAIVATVPEYLQLTILNNFKKIHLCHLIDEP